MALAESLAAAHKVLGATNTAEALTASSETVTGVVIKALAANGHVVYIGPRSAGAEGLPLEPKEWVAFNFLDPSAIFLYGTSGDGVAWLALTP